MSNNFVKNRIVDMSHNALEQVINDIMENTMTMSLQLDEYTDVSHCSQLTTVVQYVKSEKYQIRFCEPQKTTMNAQVVLGLVKENFLKLGWNMNVIGSICMDCAPSMMENLWICNAPKRKFLRSMSHIPCCTGSENFTKIVARRFVCLSGDC